MAEPQSISHKSGSLTGWTIECPTGEGSVKRRRQARLRTRLKVKNTRSIVKVSNRGLAFKGACSGGKAQKTKGLRREALSLPETMRMRSILPALRAGMGAS
eukprot:984670-Pyramimonas_sp.AAC.1